MVSLQSLYTQAEKQNIPILFYAMPGCGSMSVQLPGGSCAIGMDVAPQAEAVEREHLGHELGHCMTGSFYNIYAVADLRERQVNRADKWAIRRRTHRAVGFGRVLRCHRIISEKSPLPLYSRQPRHQPVYRLLAPGGAKCSEIQRNPPHTPIRTYTRTHNHNHTHTRPHGRGAEFPLFPVDHSCTFE